MDIQSEQTQTPNPDNLNTPPRPIDTIAISSSSHKHFIYKYKKLMMLLPLLILSIAVLAIGLSVQRSQDIRGKAALTGVSLSLSPTTKTGKVGDTFVLGVTMNTNLNTVSAAELHLSYDSTAIKILGFSPGTPLPVVLVPETHANGSISVILGAQPANPFNGANIVGTWTIKILTAKQSSIKFTNTTAVAVISQDINALTATTGSTITGVINKTPTTTPTPTPKRRSR